MWGEGNQIIATFKELSTFGGRQTHRLSLCLFTLLQATQVGNSEEEATSPRFFSIPADSSSLGSMFFINWTPDAILLSFTSSASVVVRKKRRANVWVPVIEASRGPLSPVRLQDIPSGMRDNSLSGSCLRDLHIHRESPETVPSVRSKDHWQFHCKPVSYPDLCNFIFGISECVRKRHHLIGHSDKSSVSSFFTSCFQAGLVRLVPE